MVDLAAVRVRAAADQQRRRRRLQVLRPQRGAQRRHAVGGRGVGVGPGAEQRLGDELVAIAHDTPAEAESLRPLRSIAREMNCVTSTGKSLLGGIDWLFGATRASAVQTFICFWTAVLRWASGRQRTEQPRGEEPNQQRSGNLPGLSVFYWLFLPSVEAMGSV